MNRSDVVLTESSRFHWWSLGGLGEVGMNCMVFNFGGLVIPVDAGVLFADANDFGIEAVHPNFEAFIQEYNPRHWLITHAHEDHIGAIPAVLATYLQLGFELPEIVAPHFAAALIKARLEDEQRYGNLRKTWKCIRSVDAQCAFEIGALKVQFIEGRHSTLDTSSLAFEWTSPSGKPLRVVHTSDFKLDDGEFTDGRISTARFQAFGEERPDLLLIDSTNAERAGHSISELNIIPGLERLIRKQEGRIFITLFSSNVHRVAALIGLAKKAGRHVCLAGRSLQTSFRVARDGGQLERSCPDVTDAMLLSPEEIAKHPPSRQLIICSGSQGEIRSVLNKIALEQHATFYVSPGDAVIFSSKLIPGNEKGVARLVDGLLRLGAEVHWDEQAKIEAEGPIHASGHARAGEILDVIRLLRPRRVVPVHGELHQLMACGKIARTALADFGEPRDSVTVVENGQKLTFEEHNEGWRLAGKRHLEPQKKTLRFEKFVADSDSDFLRARKRAANSGVVAVSLDSFGRSRIRFEGLMPGVNFEEDLEHWVHDQFKRLKRKRAFETRDETLEANLSDDLARYVKRYTGSRPLTFFTLNWEG